MQSQPKNIHQLFMTAIGLVLLVMALVLNHRHPHNEGIATMSHNSIYHLELTVSQVPDQVASFDFEGGIAARHQENPASTPAVPAADDQKALVITASTASPAPNASDQCQAAAIQAFDETLGAPTENLDGLKNVSGSVRADYPLAAADTNCSPGQPAPLPSAQ